MRSTTCRVIVGYSAMHYRVRRARGKAAGCVNGCNNASRYEWAHIHGSDPHDVSNYRQMCKSCHEKYDHSGAKSPRAKFTWEQVEEIRALAYFGVSQRRLAKMYCAGKTTTQHIVRCERWIPEPICTEAV
jgi:hypothetical protein